MLIIDRETITSHFDREASLQAIQKAFIKFDQGQAQVAPVVHLGFPDVDGECHIKAGHLQGDEVFIVKLATGFYQNPEQGLSSSNGFIVIINAHTGVPLALLRDEGWLTDIRTALAGVLATTACAPKQAKNLGIIGSGIQAELQATHLLKAHKFENVRLWARTSKKLNRLKDTLIATYPKLSVEIMETAKALCERSEVIISATAATAPVIQSSWIQAGTHITAVGADTLGKQELDTTLFSRAETVVVDCLAQCTEHGETANAIAVNAISADCLDTLGGVLSQGGLNRQDNDITIVDLTGVAIQDIAIAKCIWNSLSNTSQARD